MKILNEIQNVEANETYLDLLNHISKWKPKNIKIKGVVPVEDRDDFFLSLLLKGYLSNRGERCPVYNSLKWDMDSSLLLDTDGLKKAYEAYVIDITKDSYSPLRSKFCTTFRNFFGANPSQFRTKKKKSNPTYMKGTFCTTLPTRRYALEAAMKRGVISRELYEEGLRT